MVNDYVRAIGYWILAVAFTIAAFIVTVVIYILAHIWSKNDG